MAPPTRLDPPLDDANVVRCRQLGAFVRARREQLTPTSAGLPRGPRRRTPGLRREEAALLSGVSVTWYTWLEQGRNINVSRQVLSSIARALRLTAAERRHLFGLAGQPLPAGGTVDDPGPELRALVDALDPRPAYVLNARSDLLAWNHAEAGLIGDPTDLIESERNIVWRMFTDGASRRMVIDWSNQAKRLLADYRVEAAQRPGDARFTELTQALREASSEFRRWWDHDESADLQAPRRWRFDHPRLGILTLDYVKFSANSEPEHKLVAALPADAATADKLPQLAELGRV